MANNTPNLAGMSNFTEQFIATDFLLSAKTAIRSYASAFAEAASPQVQDVLRRQLDDAIVTHERATKYMISKGYYQAYNPQEQIKIDMKVAETVMNLD